ncbi:MAG: flippase-like domain-containing protein [Candidatus Hydrogenedentes bacterium]|nr:flippase-like domain-containing protein [Candidatus Hydrogenedentota bacterium]
MKKFIQFGLGLVVGVALLWWVFRGTDWPRVLEALRHAKWPWVGLAILFVIISFFTRVQRWSYIVRTAKPVSFRHMFSATQIGFLANFTLPGRAGEVIRALTLARLAHLPFSRCFAFVALDRLTDLFGLIAVMLIAVLTFHPQGAIVLPENIYSEPIPANIVPVVAGSTGIALLAIVAAFVLLYINQRLVERVAAWIIGIFSASLAEKVTGLLRQFAEGMHIFRSASQMARSLGWSLLTWGMFALGHYAMFEAFSLEYPWYAPFVLLSFLSVVIALPGAPGFIGQFHIAIAASLTILIPTIDKNTLAALVNLAYFANLLPVILVGAWCLHREQFGLLELQRESEHAEEEAIVQELHTTTSNDTTHG